MDIFLNGVEKVTLSTTREGGR